ncbi:MAG: metallophosphoesterase [Clostridiales bacterium]|jgi:predicted phosphohydrolase|nr:metallophosphoesterase [Clostridiales bacterium]
MVYAISDLHLSGSVNKPMDIFGGQWTNYWDKIKTDWTEKVQEDDVVLIAGDISWAMKPEEAVTDLNDIASLSGKKVIIKGNHEYWWNSYSKVKAMLPSGMYAIQNDAQRIGGIIAAGTRGWTIPDKNTADADVKIYEREKLRLRLTLDYAMKLYKQGGGEIYLMTHYPPFNAQADDSGFTDIIGEYPVKCVIYGHLHGKDCRANYVVVKNGIKYYLTSCDLIGNKLIRVDV